MQRSARDGSSARDEQEGMEKAKQGGGKTVVAKNNKLTIQPSQETFRDQNTEFGHEEQPQRVSGSKLNNMTASFNQEELAQLGEVPQGEARRQGFAGNQFSLQDLETSNLRNDLDESNIDGDDDDLSDIQRSHQPDQHRNDNPLNLIDMTHQTRELEGRDPNDQSLSLNQLEHSAYTYSKTNKSNLQATDNALTPAQIQYNGASDISQLDQAETIMTLQNEVR